MSELHQNIPKDCHRFNNGLQCHNIKCPYIHSETEREIALISRRQQEMLKTNNPTLDHSGENINFTWKAVNPTNETDFTINQPEKLWNYQPRTNPTCFRQVVPAISPNISPSNTTFEKNAGRAHNDSPSTALNLKVRSDAHRYAFGPSIDHHRQDHIKKGNEIQSRMTTDSILRSGVNTSPPTHLENSSHYLMSHSVSRDRSSAVPPISSAPMSRNSPLHLDSKKKNFIKDIPKSFINTNSRPPALKSDSSLPRNTMSNYKSVNNANETPLNGNHMAQSQIQTRTRDTSRKHCCKEVSNGESFLYAKRTFTGLLAQVGKNSATITRNSSLRKTNHLTPEKTFSSDSRKCDYPMPEKICSPVSEGNNSSVSGRSNSSASERSNSSVSRRSNSSASEISISLVLEKDSSSTLEKSDKLKVCTPPQSENKIIQQVENIEDISSDSGEMSQYQEVPNSWDSFRFQWIDTIKPKNKKTYIQENTVICNGTPVRSVSYNNKALMNALSGSSGEEKSFPQFMSLPAEIRNQIWSYSKYNCARTCYVKLDLKQKPGGRPEKVNGKHEFVLNPIYDAKFSYLYNIPGLFGACRESRSFVKDFYGKPKMAAVDVNTQKPFPSGQGSCIFNYEHDRLFFVTRSTTTQLPNLVQYMRREERNLIKHLAIPLKDYYFEEDTVVACLTYFPNLQSLDLVIGDGKDDLNRIGNLDYGQLMSNSIQRQHLTNDRDLDVKDRKKWTVPKVKIEFVNEVQAHIWKIDGLRWDATTRPIPRPLIRA